jgi:hypothetical protein
MVQDFAEILLSGLLAQFAELHPDAQIYSRVAGRPNCWACWSGASSISCSAMPRPTMRMR